MTSNVFVINGFRYANRTEKLGKLSQDTKSKKYNSADRVKSQYLMSFEDPHVPT